MTSGEAAGPSGNGDADRQGRAPVHVLLDQTLADSDQTLADSDQARSDSDQANADQDQQASDLDQAAADREQEGGDPGDPGQYRAARANRREATDQRLAAAT